MVRLVIQQFESIERYTEAMKYNLDHFSGMMEIALPEEARKVTLQSGRC